MEESRQLNERVGRYRFTIAGLLFLIGIVNYLDRAALGVVAPFIRQELGLTASQMGLLFSTFFIGYAAFAFIGGQLADRYGPHRVFAWAAGAWSVFCALTGAAMNFTQLLVARSAFGFAEGPISSLSNRMISNWFPREEVSRAIGFAFSGLMIGGVLAAPVVGYLALSFGWRITFWIIGGVGIVWVIVWLRLATDLPQENPRVGKSELERINAKRPSVDAPASANVLPLRAYLWRPSTLALGFGLFAMNYTVFILLSWLPTYLVDEWRMDLKTMSWVAAIPWLGGFIGFVLGGVVADAVYARQREPLRARKLTILVPLMVSVLTLLGVNLASDAMSVVALMTAGLMLLMAAMQSLWATIHELVPASHLGGVSGFIHLLSTLSGIIGPAATGFAVEHFGGFDSAFYAAAALAMASAFVMAVFVKR